MWHDMFVIQIPIAEKILRTVLVYATILILFRLTGKRDLATLNMFDFTVLFLLSNVVQNAIIGNDTSLLGGVVGAVTLVAVNAALNRWRTVSARAAGLLDGRATTIVKDGKYIPQALRHLSLRPTDLEQAIRMQNGDDVSEIATGRMEPAGHLILSLKPEEQSATKGDIAALGKRLKAIEAALAAMAPSK
jgi:uncharacterized membrane protein YcaP (DUF421 family)